MKYKKIIFLMVVIAGGIILLKKYNNSPGTNTNPVPVSEQKPVVLPEKVEWKVPFTAQAPLGKWDDVKQGNGCEEASIMMAYHWAKGTSISPDEAEVEIIKMADFSLKLLGHFHDISNEDTIKLMKEYYKYDKVILETEINIERIKTRLAQEKILVVAVNGDLLGNPNYQIPKPANHKLVITGYDETTKEFITNDPGTSRGQGFRYKYEKLFEAITDYPTGYRESFNRVYKTMIVVEKE
ncbi:MAG: C39 family peptidase [Candidatus Shapirobacteria bacterium]